MADYAQLRSIVEQITALAEKFFEHNNKAAGTRLRKNLQEVKVLAPQIRQEVTKRKASL